MSHFTTILPTSFPAILPTTLAVTDAQTINEQSERLLTIRGHEHLITRRLQRGRQRLDV